MVKINLTGLKNIDCGDQVTIKASVYYDGPKSETICLQFDVKSRDYPITYTSPILKKICSPGSTVSFEWPVVIKYVIGNPNDITAKAWLESNPSIQVTKTEWGLIVPRGVRKGNPGVSYRSSYEQKIEDNYLKIKFWMIVNEPYWIPGTNFKKPFEFYGENFYFSKGKIDKDLWPSLEKVKKTRLRFGYQIRWVDTRNKEHWDVRYKEQDTYIWLRPGIIVGDKREISIWYLPECVTFASILGVDWSEIKKVERVDLFEVGCLDWVSFSLG